MVGIVLPWYTRVSLSDRFTHPPHLVSWALVFSQVCTCPPFSLSSFVMVTCESSTARIVLEQAAATNSPRFLISEASSPNSSSIVVHRSRKLWENRPLADDLQIIDQHQRSTFISSITPLQLVRGGEGATYIRSSLPSLPIPYSYVPTLVLSPSNSLSHCSRSPRS